MARSTFLHLVAVLLTGGVAVKAQATGWGQCGGIGWGGATTCVTGWTCTYSNDWYSQCLPSTSSASTATSRTTVGTSTKATTTTSSATSKISTTSSIPTATPSGTGPNKSVAKTPVLGWNSWNAYQGNINEAKILTAANQLSSLGLKAAGYNYVNVDDCWSNVAGRDPTTQQLRPDLTKFPNGIASVADAVHALGLKFGIYSDAGLTTCSGYPGSLYYETIDAQTWSNWGVDLVKVDNCNVPSNWTDNSNVPSNYDWYNSNTALRYRRMTDALNSVSRAIVYSLCNWGNANVWTWGGRVGHSWRLTGDSSATWSFITSSIQTAASVIQYTDFWAHGDMDMMEIGNGGLTTTEERTHFAAWCFLKSPILLGTNLGALTAAQIAIITNKELLGFSQDTTYGKAAVPYGTATSPPSYFSGSSIAGAHAFGINYGSATASMVFTFALIPQLISKTSWKVHDMWTGQDLGTFSGSYTASVASHDTAALRFT